MVTPVGIRVKMNNNSLSPYKNRLKALAMELYWCPAPDIYAYCTILINIKSKQKKMRGKTHNAYFSLSLLQKFSYSPQMLVR
jgi:hypothetical protein